MLTDDIKLKIIFLCKNRPAGRLQSASFDAGHITQDLYKMGIKIDHHPIAWFLDELRTAGILKTAPIGNHDFTQYIWNKD
jgi:hypothetical protein